MTEGVLYFGSTLGCQLHIFIIFIFIFDICWLYICVTCHHKIVHLAVCFLYIKDKLVDLFYALVTYIHHWRTVQPFLYIEEPRPEGQCLATMDLLENVFRINGSVCNVFSVPTPRLSRPAPQVSVGLFMRRRLHHQDLELAVEVPGQHGLRARPLGHVGVAPPGQGPPDVRQPRRDLQAVGLFHPEAQDVPQGGGGSAQAGRDPHRGD